MRRRGGVYWQWADCQLASQHHTEGARNGLELEVQVRLSREGAIEVFIGIYFSSGQMLLEECHRDGVAKTSGEAMCWGVERARQLIMTAA